MCVWVLEITRKQTKKQTRMQLEPRSLQTVLPSLPVHGLIMRRSPTRSRRALTQRRLRQPPTRRANDSTSSGCSTSTLPTLPSHVTQQSIRREAACVRKEVLAGLPLCARNLNVPHATQRRLHFVHESILRCHRAHILRTMTGVVSVAATSTVYTPGRLCPPCCLAARCTQRPVE